MNDAKNSRAKVPMKKLRRLADRAERVTDRHLPEHAELSSARERLMRVGPPFKEGYDALQLMQPQLAEAKAQATAAADALSSTLRGWAPALESDVPGFKLERTKVHDDLIVEARHVLEIAQREELPYAEQLTEQLEANLQTLQTTAAAAQQALATDQDTRARVRALANDLADALSTLRRALRATIGTAHRDYRKLRTSRAMTRDEDDQPTLELVGGVEAPEAPADGAGAESTEANDARIAS